MKISVATITKNEEINISRLITSCNNFHEIVIVDSGSEDSTVETAAALGAKCFFSQWRGFGLQKQSAIDSCSNDWILSLDADEEVSDALGQEITSLTLNDAAIAYEIRRVSYFLGKPVRFSGWRNDYVVRLFNRKKVYVSDQLVHEKIIGYERKIRLTRGVLYHYPYQSTDDVDRKVQLYGELGAQQLLETRVMPTGLFLAHAKSIFAFVRTFILRLGFLDGWTGFQIANMNRKVTLKKYKRFVELCALRSSEMR